MVVVASGGAFVECLKWWRYVVALARLASNDGGIAQW